MAAQTGPRIILLTELTPEARRRTSELCHKHGMTQLSLISQVIEWLADQDDAVRGAVLGQCQPEIAEDIAKLILKKMSAKKGRS